MASFEELQIFLGNLKRELRAEAIFWTDDWEDEARNLVDDHGWEPDTYSSRDSITAYVAGDMAGKWKNYGRPNWVLARTDYPVSKYSFAPFWNDQSTYKADWPLLGAGSKDDYVRIALAIPLNYATNITLPGGGAFGMGIGIADDILEEALDWGVWSFIRTLEAYFRANLP